MSLFKHILTALLILVTILLVIHLTTSSSQPEESDQPGPVAESPAVPPAVPEEDTTAPSEVEVETPIDTISPAAPEPPLPNAPAAASASLSAPAPATDAEQPLFIPTTPEEIEVELAARNALKEDSFDAIMQLPFMADDYIPDDLEPTTTYFPESHSDFLSTLPPVIFADEDETDEQLALTSSVYREDRALVTNEAPAIVSTHQTELAMRRVHFGMTMPDVKQAEAKEILLFESSRRLTYLVDVAGMPCLLQYHFSLIDQLDRVSMMFGDPRLHPDIPLRTNEELLQDYQRLQILLNRKYGASEEKKQVVSNIPYINSQINLYRRILEDRRHDVQDAEQRLASRRKELEKSFEGWTDKNARVEQNLASSVKRVTDTRAWLLEAEHKIKSLERAKLRLSSYEQHTPSYSRYITHWPPNTGIILPPQTGQTPPTPDWEISLVLDLNLDVPKLRISYRKVNLLDSI